MFKMFWTSLLAVQSNNLIPLVSIIAQIRLIRPVDRKCTRVPTAAKANQKRFSGSFGEWHEHMWSRYVINAELRYPFGVLKWTKFPGSPSISLQLGYPLENVRFLLLSTNLARERLHNKHCGRAFRRYQHRRPWTTLNPKNMGFKWIFRYFWLRCTLRVNFRWNVLEIDQDNLRRK